MNIVIQKINELASAMAVSPLAIAAAVGAGNPAADMNQVVAKINKLISQGGSARIWLPRCGRAEEPAWVG